MNLKNILNRLSTVLFALLISAGFMPASPPVVMKILVLAGSTNESSYQAITTFLDQIGVPYKAVVLGGLTPDSSGNRLSKVTLSDSATGQGQYQGVILTDSTFSACGSSCLSTADWTTLNNYASQFSVRVASYFTLPAAQWGLLPADNGIAYKASNPLNVTLTKAGTAVFPYLNSNSSFPIAGEGTSSIKAYQATTTAAANETTTPLLNTGAYTVAATHTTADGRETLALTMDNAPTLIHSLAFNYGVINWVAKGVFLGARKLYLNPENDDFLNGNWIYAPALHPACESNDTCPRYIASGPDLQTLAAWQTNLQADPQFQSFRETMAFNGVGTTWFDPQDPVFAAIKSVGSQFWWVSHSWDHPNLDCYTLNQKGACVPATLAQSLSELNQNIAVAPSLGITLDQTSMVTPYNSGLSNPNFLQAAKQVGIQYIVFPQLPNSPNVPIVNTLAQPIVEVTRMNNNLFDDVSSPLTGVYGSWPDEYNAQFGPNGVTPTYGQNLTYSQILDIESQTFLENMLSYAPYPTTFHIASMYPYDGTHSLYTDLIDAITTKYKKLFTLPVLSVNLESIGTSLTERSSYNASGVIGVYTPGVSVVLKTTQAATIPLTGLCSQTSCGTYGGQVQDKLAMAAGSTVTIPLPVVTGVTLSSLTVSPTSVPGGTSATGTVTLNGAAPAGGASVSLSSNSASASVPASITVGAGSNTATFTVSTATVTSPVAAIVTAGYSGSSQTATLNITAPAIALATLSVAPNSVNGGSSATGTVTLSGAAPTGGISVLLTSNNASATVPASVTIAAGNSTATFNISTTAVTSATSAILTASYNSGNKTATLAITAPTLSLVSIGLNPASVAGGKTSTGTITLSGAAPSGGISVSLTSSSAAATVPASVTVTAGSTTSTFTISTASVTSSVSATLTATYSGLSKTAVLTVTPATTVALSAVALNPATIASNTNSTGTVTLSAAAPTGGISVALSSNNTASATVPSGVTIPAGSTSANFTVTAKSVAGWTAVTITAAYNGTSKTAALTVTPDASVAVSSVSVSPTSVASTNTTTGSVTLTKAAPAGGIVVALWTTGVIAYVPVEVTVPAGSTSATFTVTTNYTATTLQDTITAFYNGVGKTAAVTVTP